MHRRPYQGPHPADPAATAGLRRRLIQRTADRIEVARANGDWHQVEELTAAHYAAQRAKDRAAALARVPLCERISMGKEKNLASVNPDPLQ
jgi:hypothetical protein